MKYRDDGRPRVNRRKLKHIMQRKATLQGRITGGTLPPYVRHLQLSPEEPPGLAKTRPPTAKPPARKAPILNRDASTPSHKAPQGAEKGAPKTPASDTRPNLSAVHKKRAVKRNRAEAERHARRAAQGQQTTLRQGRLAGPTERKLYPTGNTLGPSDRYTWAQRNDFGDWRER